MLQEAPPKSHVYTLGALGGYKPQIEGGPWEHAFSYYTLYYVWLRGQGCWGKSMSIWTCGLHSARASRILPLSLTPEPYGLTASYGFGIGSGSHVSGVFLLMLLVQSEETSYQCKILVSTWNQCACVVTVLFLFLCEFFHLMVFSKWRMNSPFLLKIKIEK